MAREPKNLFHAGFAVECNLVWDLFHVLAHAQENRLHFHEGSQLEKLIALAVEGACVSVWYVQPVHRVCHHSFREVYVNFKHKQMS